jgi:hypothetical protein
MNELRRKPTWSGVISVFALFITSLVALPALALGAPEGTAPQLGFEPASYDFGLQQANSYSGQTTLQLRNGGEAAEQILSLDISGGSGAFGINGTDCSSRTLAPGETCWVGIEFTPYDVAPFAAQLRAHLEGGATVSADLSGEGGRAILTPAANPTSFGAVPVGSPGVVESIEIRNTGNMAGGFFIAVIASGAVGSFQLLDEDCTGISLSPDGACSLLVGFQPLSTGVKTARLALFGDSDGGTGVVLTGVGTEPESFSEETAPALTSSDEARAKARRHRRHRSRRHKGAQRRRHRAALASGRVSH